MDRQSEFERIVEENYDLIYKFCFVKLRFDDEAATEVTADTFMVLKSKLDALDLDGNVAGWLVKTAQNRILKWNERASRYKSRVIYPGDGDLDGNDSGERLEERVIDSVADGEFIARVESALDPAERTLFRLRYLDEKNATEIASELSLPYTTTRMRLKRLESRLRDILTESADDKPAKRKRGRPKKR